MEFREILRCLSIVFAFSASSSSVLLVIARMRRNKEIPQSEGISHGGCAAWYIRNGVGWMLPPTRILLKNNRLGMVFSEAAELLTTRGYAATSESVCSAFLAAIIIGSTVVGVLTSSALCSIALVICVVMAGVFRLNAAKARRVREVSESVPDALQSMGVCFQTGLSLIQTFRQTAGETRGPLKKLFEQAAHRLETGQSVENALTVFRAEASIPELSFVAVALGVQHEAGGSMREVLDSVSDTVKDEIELKRSLKVQTAQAKLSAQVVSLLPFALIALFSLVSKDFLAPFFGSVAGVVLLGIALSMQGAGIVLVRRMLSVEVG